MEIKIWVLFDLFDRFSHKLAILNLTSHCTSSSVVRALDCSIPREGPILRVLK